MVACASSQTSFPSRKRLSQIVAALFVVGAGSAHAVPCPDPVGGTITVENIAVTQTCTLLHLDPAAFRIDVLSDSIISANGPAVVTDTDLNFDYVKNAALLESSQPDGFGVLLNARASLELLENREGGRIAHTNDSGTSVGVQVSQEARLTKLDNQSGGEILGRTAGVVVAPGGGSEVPAGRIDEIINEGLIESDGSSLFPEGYAGIFNEGLINKLMNTGTIRGQRGVYNRDVIEELVNRGAIEGFDDESADISNEGIIEYLENSQERLSLSVGLPLRYAVVIDGGVAGGLDFVESFGIQPVDFHQDENGCMEFGITQDSAVTQASYPNVLTGVFPGQLCNTSGTFQGLSWVLTPTFVDVAVSASQLNAQDNHLSWDLTFSGDSIGPTPIPTLSHLGLAVLAALTALIGLRNRRRTSA